MNSIERIFEDSIQLKQSIIDRDLLYPLSNMGKIASDAISDGGKILLCGNGGSAADAQHLAAELLVRLKPLNNREGIPAIVLAQDTSTITACGNDFGYDKLYQRMVQALGREGDILLGISTSGNSENIVKAMKQAQSMGIKIFGFLGSGGGRAINYCDESFLVPSNDTGRIQEAHITAGHALMEVIEDYLLDSGYLTLED